MHGLQMKLARAKKMAADKGRHTRKLNTTTNEKERHIDVLQDQVQTLQAQVAILQHQNINLCIVATATEAEHISVCTSLKQMFIQQAIWLRSHMCIMV
jgi:fructose-1,6-bisphosphatase/sedoheptulose 1,7-bisphosphatase-like protein